MAAGLETCLPQNSQIFKNNQQLLFGFCFKRHFFSLYTELCSSGKVSPSWQLNEQGKEGEGLSPEGQGSALLLGHAKGVLWHWAQGPGWG